MRELHIGSGRDQAFVNTFTGRPLYEKAGFQTVFPLRSSITAGAPAPGTVYLEVGLYRDMGPESAKYTVYHDEVRRLANPNDQVAC